MINHSRTLLLNKPAAYFDGAAGNEYVPPDFVTLPLDTTLRRMYSTLIPTGLDPTGENYVAAVLMQILDCPELITYTRAFDPRVTYSNSTELLAKLTDDPVTIVVQQSAACDVVPRYAVDGANQPNSIPISGKQVWTCTPEDTANLRVANPRDSGSQVVPVLSADHPTRSLPITLIQDYLDIYFDLPSAELTGDFRITYSTIVAPPYDVADKLAALDTMFARPGTLDRLFQAVHGYEHLLIGLRDTWIHAHESTLRFGAAVLGYLVQCESLRRASGAPR